MFFAAEYPEASYGGQARLKYTIEVVGGDDFPVRVTFASDHWYDKDPMEPVPMKRGHLALGATEAQALAVAILLVAADSDPNSDWAKQTLNFDLTGPNFHFVDAQLPRRYFSAIREARLAVRKVMDSP